MRDAGLFLPDLRCDGVSVALDVRVRARHPYTAHVSAMPLVSALGCAIRIDTSDLSAADRVAVADAWAGARVTDSDPLPAAHRTLEVSGTSPIDRELSVLSQRLTLEAIEARRGELWMLHAAAVADAEGRVVAVIGPSGRGKTTAARALAETYGYVSDETVGIDSSGQVHPYRKPLSIVEESAVKAQRAPAELGLRELPATPLRLSALVLLDRRPDGPDVPVVEPCDLGEVLPELVEQTSYLADLPRPLRTIAACVRAVDGVHRVVYREAATLPKALAPLFTDPRPVRVEEAGWGARRMEAQVTDEVDAVPEAVFRGAFLDAIEFDDSDRVALLQPDLPTGATLRMLSGIAPALWRAADPASRPALVQAAVDAYGLPENGDPARVVDDALDDLCRQGVLTTDASWRIRDDVAWTGSDDRFVVLQLTDLADPSPLALEGSAAIIWGVLAAGRGRPENALIDAVAAQVHNEADVVRPDVRAFLRTLQDGGLAERIAP